MWQGSHHQPPKVLHFLVCWLVHHAQGGKGRKGSGGIRGAVIVLRGGEVVIGNGRPGLLPMD